MSAVHIHLIVNHIPVILTGASFMLLALSLVNKKRDYREIAFIGYVVAAIFVLITFESGENAEDIVENIADVSHDRIEDHEHAAETARWLTLMLGVAGFAGLTYFKRETRKGYKAFLYISLLVSMVVIGYLAYTGYLGGMIRHTELH